LVFSAFVDVIMICFSLGEMEPLALRLCYRHVTNTFFSYRS
jgi:hypothetical protein